MSDTTQTAQILKITGMSCDGCASTVKAALEAVPGVIAAEVTLDDHRAMVVSTAEVTRRTLVDAVTQAGYGVI